MSNLRCRTSIQRLIEQVRALACKLVQNQPPAVWRPFRAPQNAHRRQIALIPAVNILHDDLSVVPAGGPGKLQECDPFLVWGETHTIDRVRSDYLRLTPIS